MTPDFLQITLPYVFCLLAAYLAGSVNFAWLLAKRRGFDIRSRGSCNAGATNAGRTMGPLTALLVFSLDACKAAGVVYLSGFLFPESPSLPAATALGCVVGHLFPFYLEFRGGKGVSVLMGSALALDWRLFLLLLAWTAAVSCLSDYMFIGTLTAAVGYVVWFWLRGRPAWDLALMILSVGLIFWQHRKNFRRFFAGKELGLHATFFGKGCRAEHRG